MAAFALTAAALLCLAGNSILGRLALGANLIDGASYASIRTASGALMLITICVLRRGAIRPGRADFPAASMLFAYMVCFSFAYHSLTAGTGALILFGAVQITMIGWAIRRGESLSALSWTGLCIAMLGLIWLVLPGLSAPDPMGATLMTLAGIAWGAYSLLGRGSLNPVSETTRNFLLATPMALAFSAVSVGSISLSGYGVTLAVASGAVTSGIGYVLWYAAMRNLSRAQAASLQLTVPVIAAILGIVLLSEALNFRLVSAALAILGGVAVVMTQRQHKTR